MLNASLLAIVPPINFIFLDSSPATFCKGDGRE
jgi:hypothetical protein